VVKSPQKRQATVEKNDLHPFPGTLTLRRSEAGNSPSTNGSVSGLTNGGSKLSNAPHSRQLMTGDMLTHPDRGPHQPIRRKGV
jgi:hypothetical protein